MIRFLSLPVLLVVLLGVVYVLPERGRVAESAVRMELPLKLGDWDGVLRPETEQERNILAKDTEFAKADYLRPSGDTRLPGGTRDFDRVSVSVVLSGYDINNSIHRPERCLPAQGHQIQGSSGTSIELPNGRALPVRRLTTRQKVRVSEDSDEVVLLDSLVYYFFVGHESVTNDHYERTFIDMRDRLIYGRDQRWAYVTVAASQGVLPWSGREVTAAEADRMLGDFCARLAGGLIDWERVAR